MKITPVSPIPPLNNSAPPRYFSQNHANKETNMSNNTNNIQESNEDNTATRDIDYGNLALNRGFWTPLIIGGYVTIIILANIALSS
tara:strand:+ start:505 stop:762 length:258 start_codon:yes stop_codon:yes gene_type:complete